MHPIVTYKAIVTELFQGMTLLEARLSNLFQLILQNMYNTKLSTLKQTNAHVFSALSASNASISILQFFHTTYHHNTCDNSCDNS